MEGNHSLRRRERLRENLRFKIIKDEARPIKGASFIINICPNKLPFNRIAISISSKAILKSSRRNKLKRLIREAYRLHKGELKEGFDIVVRSRSMSKPLNFKQAEKDLLYIFKKAGMLR